MKSYTVRKIRKGRETLVEGTVAEKGEVMYYINVKLKNEVETIDEFESYKEAKHAVKEYRMITDLHLAYISTRCTKIWKERYMLTFVKIQHKQGSKVIEEPWCLMVGEIPYRFDYSNVDLLTQVIYDQMQFDNKVTIVTYRTYSPMVSTTISRLRSFNNITLELEFEDFLLPNGQPYQTMCEKGFENGV